MDQYAEVVALTTTPLFIILHHDGSAVPGSTYTPAVGQRGFMLYDDAVLADVAGDVLMAELTEVVDYTNAQFPIPITAVADDAPGTADTPADIIVGGGPADMGYTITVGTAIDSGGADSQDVLVTSGQTAAQGAAAIGALTIPGITTGVVGSVVTLTPGAGTAITTLTASVAVT